MLAKKHSRFGTKNAAHADLRRSVLRTLGATLWAPLATSLTTIHSLAFGKEASIAKPKVGGSVVTIADEVYDITRLGLSWQTRKSSHRPRMIVQARSVEDVVATVNYAREHRLKLAVRSAGHSWVNSSLRDDSVLIDMGRFRHVSVDSVSRRARIGPAVTARDLLHELKPYGFSFPVAHCGTVPIGGYLLGGGLGWNYQAWGGMACFCVQGIDVVTADGKVVYADDKQNSDLLWAARGSGPGFFGVVTRFHLKLFSLPKAVTLSTYSWPLEHAGAVGDWMTKNFEVLPDNVELQGFMLTDPGSPWGRCDPRRKTCSVSAYGFYDELEESREALAPLMQSVPVAEHVTKKELQPTSIEGLLATIDKTWLPARFEADTSWSEHSLGEIGVALKDHFACAPSPMSAILFEPGRKNKQFPDAAFSMWARSLTAIYAIWNDPKTDQENFDWVAKAMDLLAPLQKGHFISESNLLAGRAEGSYALKNWEWLRVLRRRYDPEGLFHSYLGKTDSV